MRIKKNISPFRRRINKENIKNIPCPECDSFGYIRVINEIEEENREQCIVCNGTGIVKATIKTEI